MKLKTDRAWNKPTYCIGRFFINGIRFYESLEDTDRGLAQNWTEAAIKAAKIYGQTAIPSGTYEVVLTYSKKFKNKSWAKKYGGQTPEIIGVPGFSGVRIHPANYASELGGCIALGENKVKGGVINSKKRYEEFMDKYFMPAWSRKEKITITIK